MSSLAISSCNSGMVDSVEVLLLWWIGNRFLLPCPFHNNQRIWYQVCEHGKFQLSGLIGLSHVIQSNIF